MPEEFLDIVSENNELTGESALRSRVHAEGLWHRTVHIYLFRKVNDEVEFLVHLRSSFKEHNPNKWGRSFGGHIKAGDSFQEAVESEMKEEIGLEVDFEKLLGGYWRKHDGSGNREFTKNYAVEYDGKLEDLKFNDGEVQTVKWMSISEIHKSIADEPEKWAGGPGGITMMADCLSGKM